MKAVMISIKPKWCELIANGEKTIEVRKTIPEIDVPFKCYIYATKSKRDVIGNVVSYYFRSGIKFDVGKVIGSFICDKIEEHSRLFVCEMQEQKEFNLLKNSCLSIDDINNYLKGADKFYGWHISDLKIYDKPKELGEFRKAGFMTEEDWQFALYPNTHCHYAAWAKKFEMSRPPQSWCYCEELEENKQ